MFTNIALIVAAYLLGSVCSGIIVCRIMRLPDPRSDGSRNPGATNVLRLYGKKAAAITLAGDMLKGLIPMLIVYAGYYPSHAPLWLLGCVGLAAFIGHLYPLWFGFQGGKGVATALGVQLGLYWLFGGAVAILWLVVAKLTRISSLGGLVSMTLAPLILWLVWPAYELLAMQLVMSWLIVWRHRSNIRSLIAGTERSIQQV